MKKYKTAVAVILLVINFLVPGMEPGGLFVNDCFAQNAQSARQKSAEDSDSITISIITCSPGPEIYELCGHTAVRVRGEGIDSVWNYGMFNFNEPNFVYRFVKGETDYMCAAYPFSWFMPEYISRGSKVTEQDLALSQKEARQILGLLRTNALDVNKYYRYRYVSDNCATRPLDILERGIGERVIINETTAYGTIRDEMRAYHKNYPWYQFGIDLALGTGLDSPVSRRTELFVPLEMMQSLGKGERIDGRRIVSDTRILYKGEENAILPPTPFWLSPLAVAIAIFILSLGICIYDLSCDKLARWWYSIWFGVLGIAGLIITFLVFVSTHEFTSPNNLIWWINPVQIIPAIAIWFKNGRSKMMKYLMLIETVAMILLLIAWPFQSQSANLAFFPLMAATLLMSLSYSLMGIKTKKSTKSVVSKGKKTKSQKQKTRKK